MFRCNQHLAVVLAHFAVHEDTFLHITSNGTTQWQYTSSRYVFCR